MAEMISIRDASRITDYSVEYIRKLVRDGLVRGRKVVNVWLVDLDDLQAHRARMAEKVENK